MTAIDDAASDAVAMLKGAESVVQAYNAMGPDSRKRFTDWFPTMNANVQTLANAYNRAFPQK